MLNVIIEAQGLRSAIKLKKILEDRRALVEFSKDKVESQDRHLSHRASEICFICSEDFSNSIKGPAGLIEVAKGYKASSIVVVNQTDDTFSLKEDLGGKLLHVNLPDCNDGEDTTNNYGFQIIATLVARNNQFIAERNP